MPTHPNLREDWDFELARRMTGEGKTPVSKGVEAVWGGALRDWTYRSSMAKIQTVGFYRRRGFLSFMG